MAKMTLLNGFSQALKRRPLVAQGGPIMFRASITNAPNPVTGTNDMENPTTEGTTEQIQKTAEEPRRMVSSAAARIEAHELGEQAKETAHGAWESTKEKTHEAKNRAAGVVEQTAESVKANAEKVERAMNTKN